MANLAYLDKFDTKSRKRDRHKLPDNLRRVHRARSTFFLRPIVTVDSEAATDPDGYHRLIMVSAAGEDGREWTLHGKDLATETIFDWLMTLKLENRQAHFVMYAGNYDFNMWIKDLVGDRITLIRLSTELPARWRNWRISHIMNHTTSITKVNDKGERLATILLWDVIGFFQQSFVKTLRDWKIGTEEVINAIEDMKLQRSEFSEDMREQIANYNLSECRLHNQVVRRLLDLCATHGIKLSRLDGAGAAAAAMLRYYKIEQYLENPPEIEDIARWALFGGRIDIAKAGTFYNVWGYDINSAYPTACRDMPCWTHGLWKETKASNWPLPLGIYRVRFNFARKLRTLCPLPFRRKDGGIRYPATGQGHYWSAELNSLTEKDKACITIVRGWQFIRGCEHQPFGFISNIYDERRKLKAKGDLGHQVLKLPLNALYGKLAQSSGYKGRKPRYQSFVAAGYVTAYCRAQINKLIGANRNAILSIATDGILSLRRLETTVSSNLGEMEEVSYQSVFIVQPGVYALWKDGKRNDKTRGATRTEFDIGQLIERWQIEESKASSTGVALFERLQFTYQERRFFGLKIALTRHDWPRCWRSWMPVERTVKAGSARHLTSGHVKDGKMSITMYSPINGEGDADALEPTSLFQKMAPGPNMMSARYEPKREATWTEAELLHHYQPDPGPSSYHIWDRER